MSLRSRFPHLTDSQLERYERMLANSPPLPCRDKGAERLPAEPVAFRRCKYVGEATDVLVGCSSCSGVKLKTSLCQLHNVPCVTSARQPTLKDDVRWCRACDDHDAATD
jgi:hypothetical protein